LPFLTRTAATALLCLSATSAPAWAFAADGTYRGHTGQHLPLTLVVERGRVASLTFRYRLPKDRRCLVVSARGTWKAKAGSRGEHVRMRGRRFTWKSHHHHKVASRAQGWTGIMYEDATIKGRFAGSHLSGRLSWDGGIPYDGGELCYLGPFTWTARLP
jgi:hypothetical protein